MSEASNVDLTFEVGTGFIARVLLSAIGFVGTIIFARILGPRSFGGYYLLLTVVLIAIRPAQGIAVAAKKRFAETQSRRVEIVGAQLLTILVFSVVSAIAALLFNEQIIGYTGLDSAPLLLVVLVATVSVIESITTLMEGAGRVSVANGLDLVGSILTFPAQLVLVLAGLGAAGMAYGLSAASALTAIVGLYLLGITPRTPSVATLRSIWEFARFSMISALVGKVLFRADILLLGFLLTPAAVGQYEVALKLSVPAMFVAMVAGNALMARVSNFDSKAERKQIVIDLKNTLSFTPIVAIPMLFGALALDKSLVVTLYGSEYRQATELLVWLVLYQLVRSQASPLLSTIDGLDRPDISLLISSSTLVLNVFLGIAMIAEYGIVGAVYATVIAELLRYVSSAMYVRHLLPESILLTRNMVEQFVAGGLMYAVVHLAHTQYPVQGWEDLILLVVLGALSYSTVLLAISKEHRGITAKFFDQIVPH